MGLRIRYVSYLLSGSIIILVLGILFNPFAPRAHAMLNKDIDLTKTTNIRTVSMSDWRWNGTPIDPFDPSNNNKIGNCGCYVSALATMLSYAENGYFPNISSPAVPWYRTDFEYSGYFRYNEVSWNPVYVMNYLRYGSKRSWDKRPVGWGFKIFSSCGMISNSSALGAAGEPALTGLDGIANTTGIQLAYISQGGRDTPGLTPNGRIIIDDSLNRNTPVMIGIHKTDKNGNLIDLDHTFIIVGWDNFLKEYLVLNPSETDTIPRIPQPDKLGGSYEDFLNQIYLVIPAIGVSTETKNWRIRDDPSPVDFAVTDPQGRRSGYNPSTDTYDQDSPDAHAYRKLPEASTDPVSSTDPNIGNAASNLDVDNPQEGTWRVEVYGAADGQYDYKFMRDDATEDKHVTGTITKGQKIKYEYHYNNTAAPEINEVTNFSPEAREGSDRTLVTGQSLLFDGRSSFDVDGSVTSWAWNFGDGTSGTGNNVNHAFMNPGTYTVTLSVTDNEGATGTTTINVLVSPPPQVGIERADVANDSSQARSPGGKVSMSRDARFVAFESDTATIVPGDTNNATDIFVRDRQNGTTERVSVNTDGSQMSNASQTPWVSHNGRYVLFVNSGNLWLRDRQSELTEEINTGPDGQAIQDNNILPGGVSDDGRFVTLQTSVPLIAGDNNFRSKIYLRDRVAGTITHISDGHDEVGANSVVMSSDGNTLAYLGTEPGNTATFELYTYNRTTATTTLVSINTNGSPTVGGARTPDLTPDGRFLSFTSNDGTLDGTVHPNGTASYIKNLENGSLTWVDAGANVKLSDDAQKMVYDKGFVYDRSTGTKRRAAVTSLGQAANDFNVTQYAISGDGRYVGFGSNASNLVPGDTNNATDIFVRDMDSHIPPVADTSGPYVGFADPGITVTGGGEVLFNGVKSLDPEGDKYTATWDFGDGTPPITVNNSTATSHRYAGPTDNNDLSYTVKLTLKNYYLSSNEASTTVTVKPMHRSAGGVVSPSCGLPGDTITIGGIAKPSGSQEWNFKNSWDLANGPMPAVQVEVRPPLNWNLSFNDFNALVRSGPAYPPNYEYSFTMTIPSSLVPRSSPFTYFGGVNFNANTVSGNWPIKIPCPVPANQPPSPKQTGPFQTKVGVAVTFDGSGSTDPENDAITYHWDFGDGTVVDNGGPNPTHTYTHAATYIVSLTVLDATSTLQSSHAPARTQVVVEANPNVKPLITTDNILVGTNEGSPATNTGTFSDPSNTAVTLSASLGTVTDAGSGKWQWTYTPPDGPASQTITITATNAAGLSETVTFNLGVTNVPPSIQSVSVTNNDDIACATGNTRTLSFNVSDPAGINDPIQGTISWGDGSADTSYSGNSFNGTHSYAPGVYEITITANDGDGGITISHGTFVKSYYKTGVLDPINTDGSSNFKLGSTIPLSLGVTDCQSAFVGNLQPKVSLERIGTGAGQVNEVVSSSAADSGNIMRMLNSKYMFNLSSKKSQFTNNVDLTAGRYRITITEPYFAPLVAEFNLL